MKIKFWGVRGSIPTPLTSKQIKSRISAVIQRIKPADLTSPENRELFLARLPEDIFGTVGGNTTCIEVKIDAPRCFVIDAGTGIRELGNYYTTEEKHIHEFHIFFTHFHWDHIQGIPFFSPAFNKRNTIFLYSPVPDFEKYLRDQMRFPYFPVGMDILPADIHFIELNGTKLTIDNTEIAWKRMKHPGGSFAYKVVHKGKSAIVATDSEITEKEFLRDEENTVFFKDAHVLILDSQYTLEESIDKIDWGHSSYSIDVDLASVWGVKNLVLFHHEPLYNDKKIIGIERLSKWYLNHLKNKYLSIMVAVEGKEIVIE
ncbi:MAG: MBL fold metallo-hydrolase [Spirochaetales bacterium]|nr:MBL fold metallo-hydrolase [Spirochaetales bacterium]